ncbi:MAG: hypothetical protein LC768_02285 [Acidobacteria bacterium]|nr:hypothetical protein [Acidobacteriota bacterium]MCA1637160.1 hypothetical protein [Acidobacteriota bacterium]
MKIRIMKQFNGFRALFSIVAIVMVFTIVNINSAYAIDPSASPTPEASPSPNPTPYKKERKHSDTELEKLRGKITEVLTTVEDVSNTITPGNTNAKKRFTAAKSKLAAFSLDDLDTLSESINLEEVDDELVVAKEKLEKIKPVMKAAYAQLGVDSWKTSGDNDSSDDPAALKSTLPGIDGPDAVCQALIGAGRAKLDVVIAANAAYIATKILDIAFNRGCNQVVVAGVIVLGAGGVGGGNSSLACIVTDGLLFAAEQVRDKVNACDDNFTERSVDTAVKRMETIHTDLDNSIINDNNNATSIIANDNSNKTNIINDAATNKTTITTAVTDAKTFIDGNATTNKNTIVADALANKNTITSAINTGTTTVTTAVGDGTTTILINDNKNKNTIVEDAKTNKEFVVDNAKTNKEFLLRMQIEADLSSTDGATFVAMFLTPGNVCAPVLNDKGVAQSSQQCGYLDFARAIVAQTIANLAGSNTALANSFLTKGDTYKSSGDYRQAYQNYRLAYKTAAGISTK